jgi:hypothetical protein
MALHRRQTSFPNFSWRIEDIGSLTDELGRRQIAEEIANRLRGPERPGVIGVYGSWGSGKTYLLSQVIRLLLEQNCREKNQVLVCVFQAWKYEMEGNLAAGLIKALSHIAESAEEFWRVSGCCHPQLPEPERHNYKEIARELIQLILDIGPDVLSLLYPPAGPLAKAIQPIAKKLAEKSGAENSHDILESVTDKIYLKVNKLVESILNAAEKADSTRQYRLAIFIDDLDRCSPEDMVRMFEWMKVHLRAENCTYVLALDHMAAARAIVGRYREYLGEEEDIAYGLRYLEKLVDIEYELGPSQGTEFMAVKQIFRHPTWHRLSEAARADYGSDFPGLREMDRLLALPCLCTPRTMLKIVYKFQNLFSLTLEDNASAARLRSMLPASYPFWLLFLIAMYYQLEPERLTEFIQGRGPVHLCLQHQENPENYVGPLKEFCQFAAQIAGGARSLPLPSPEMMEYLARMVRENILPPI